MSPDELKRFNEWLEWDHQSRRELAAIISPSGEWFAWRPVRLKGGGWAWMRRVHWFRPLGLLTEYSEIER